jgi:DNA-binding transcriptional LysR family regulator
MRHLRILELVDEVARTGSIRRAAARLNFTASALTRRIQDLESELGVVLFERTSRGMRPTTAGDMFLAHTREQLAEAERLKSGLEDLQGLRRGKVRVACSQAVAPEFMPRAIGVFRGLYPMVDFDVRVVDHEQAATALASYDVDLALVFSPDSLPGFERLALLEQRLVALMPREHVLCEKPELRLRDCVGHSLALPDRSTGGRQLLDAFSARTGITFEVAIESNSFEFLRRSVVQSGLVSFQIDVGAPAADADSDIIVRKIDRRDAPPANLVLGKLPGRNLPQICLIFAEYVMDRMALMRDGRAPFENTAD